MANSNWIQLANIVLRQSGLPEIPDDGVTFDNPLQGLMTRYQLAAREFVRTTHEMVSVDLPTGFARRRFTLNIDNVQGPIYNLDSGMSVESLTFDSFRNLSVTPPGPGQIRNWTYEYFTKYYADVSLIQSGAPTNFILLPVLRQNVSPIYQVRMFPNPDQAYTIEYVAQLNPYALKMSTDLVLWPPEYEHVITSMARFSLEDLLGEGKAGSLGAQAAALYAKARQKATQPVAERKKIRMKQMYAKGYGYGGGYGTNNGVGPTYYYPSPPDNDAPYTSALDHPPYRIR